MNVSYVRFVVNGSLEMLDFYIHVFSNGTILWGYFFNSCLFL